MKVLDHKGSIDMKEDDCDSPESVDSGCVPDKIDSDIINWDNVKKSLTAEQNYINTLIKYIPTAAVLEDELVTATPSKKSKKRKREQSESKVENVGNRKSKNNPAKKVNFVPCERVDNYSDLVQRLEEKLKEIRKSRKGKKKGLDRGKEKNITSKLAKLRRTKLKKDKKAKKDKRKITPDGDIKPEKGKQTKQIYNASGQLVFSKFDFGTNMANPPQKKKPDLHHSLSQVLKKKKEVKKLESTGEIAAANEVKSKSAWESALAKAQGEKVRDNPELIKKSLKRLQAKKKVSKKKWDERKEKLDKQMEEKRTKRQDNIRKKKQDKLGNKMKKLKNKGHIVPGF